MASLRWSNLPADVLSSILNILNSDVDLLRLRSVCPSWRSSLPLPTNPISFPLKLPPLSSPPGVPQDLTLRQINFYRLSLPAGDPSTGWLFKVSETKSNTFSLLNTLTTQKIAGATPNRLNLNLLDYRISEIYKSYTVDPGACIKRVIGLWNYVSNCEFAVMVLQTDGRLCYWKIGDPNWTPIAPKGYKFDDVILFDRKCYAIDHKGIFVSFDSEMKSTVIVAAKLEVPGMMQNYLVESDSDLFVVSKMSPYILDFYFEYLGKREIDDRSPINEDHFGLMLNRLDKSTGKWLDVGALGDKAFVLSEDSSFSIRAKEFSGCTGNCVYLTDWCMVDESHPGEGVGFYRMGGHREFILTAVKDSDEICSPPPSWVYV